MVLTSGTPMQRARLLAVALASFLLAEGARAQMRWVPLGLGGGPQPRGAPAMAYDPVRREIVLFGGYPAAGDLNDTWILHRHAWTQAHPAVSPPARAPAGFPWEAPVRQ